MPRLGCILVAWMFTAAFAWAQDEVEHLSERDWQIPITLSEPIRKEAQSLTLFVSNDLGKTWKKEATAKPSDDFFKYLAPSDGIYWFSVSFVNKSGQTVPPKETDLQPQLKIVVDTKRPEVKLQTVERTGEQVTVQWDVKDDHLDLNSLTLQYRSKGDNAWKAVSLTPVASGKKQFSTGAMTAVEVRVSAKDKAGNTGEDRLEVAATSPTVVTANQVSPSQPVTSQLTGQGSPPAPAVPLLGAGTTTAPANPSLNSQQPTTQPKVDGTLPPPFPTNNMPPAFGAAPTTGTNPANTRSYDQGFKPVTGGQTTQQTGTGYNNNFQRGQAGPVLWSNSLHLDLDFDVKAGPSGVGLLELYYTLDAGKTWQLLDKREEAAKPFSVDVPAEGIYGFTMVVKNKAGLGRAAPAPGELPEVRVGVDVTAPVCELITPLETVPGSKDLLNIKWTAIDSNMASGPVKIEWSENPNGPWHEVVKNHPNNGVYRWRVPQNTPYQVYLKMEVTDMAGNAGQFITREPVLVDLQMPEVKIKGLTILKK
ncbi:MAG TPA: hypothetical protein PLX97_05055 [Gemmatales bacterium]|nr:hypothetical protein [Gemmatales bacterium]